MMLKQDVVEVCLLWHLVQVVGRTHCNDSEAERYEGILAITDSFMAAFL